MRDILTFELPLKDLLEKSSLSPNNQKGGCAGKVLDRSTLAARSLPVGEVFESLCLPDPQTRLNPGNTGEASSHETRFQSSGIELDQD
ncbi:hypothetical protein CDAR_191771 [Caerostris darwini]|uniref:Uncharacterized protein n=1 Tax=Caerostris darwini TaxID=1538125 RepID=A0AAV4P9Z1_9ARAC|nr:hypothetical protein CDAR_191771 [Caerostris darwini]